MSKELEALEGLKAGCFYDNERAEYVEDTDEFKIIEQALTTKSKKEQAFDYLIKHFNIECGVDSTLDGEVWARFVHIQAKEDDGTWDTTATANLVDYKEDFDLLKSQLEE